MRSNRPLTGRRDAGGWTTPAPGHDSRPLASPEEAVTYAPRVLGLDELQAILDRFGISWHDYLGLPAEEPPLRLRVLRVGKRC